MNNIGIFNTSIGSTNLGDHIIMQSVLQEIEPAIKYKQQIHFSSHDAHLYNALKIQKNILYNVLCGTNCLGSKMWFRPSWAINLATAPLLKPTITLGVGWGAYQSDPDLYTKMLLRNILRHDGFLSVRDEYTKEKLESVGFKNVLNTACLTMWQLNSDKCDIISKNKPFKSDKVIYTLTDYARDHILDFQTIKTLLVEYEHLYIWIQGSRDYAYLKEIQEKNPHFFKSESSSITIIPPTLKAFDHVLTTSNIDYVGTRLHGGIRALQHGARTIIIGVDNRALEKKKDFNLPVIPRVAIDELSNVVNQKYILDIKLPVDEINKFKKWFLDFNTNYSDQSFNTYMYD